MEAIWMIPLYFILPITAIVFIITGGITKSRHKIKIGLMLLVLPILHLVMMYFTELELENKLAGKYTIDNPTPTLTLNNDGTFYLKQSINYPDYSGKGNWDIEIGELTTLTLEFEKPEGNSLSFNFDENNPNELQGIYSFLKVD